MKINRVYSLTGLELVCHIFITLLIYTDYLKTQKKVSPEGNTLIQSVLKTIAKSID